MISSSQIDFQIDESEYYKSFEEEMDYLSGFLGDLSFLIFCNGRIISAFLAGRHCQLFTTLIDSASQTIKSIKLCCSIGAFSDANSIIRKLRDDLLQYVYIISVLQYANNNLDLDDLYIIPVNTADVDNALVKRLTNNLSEDEQAVRAWFDNTIDNQRWPIRKKLDFQNYMKVLKENSFISHVLGEYNLDDYWDKLSKRLNNYVHGNGPFFALHNRVMIHDKNLEIHLKNVAYRTSYVTSFFMVLLLMIESSLISSTDLIDYLDANAEIPEGCQNWVAPFVQEFIDKKVSTLHPELKQYLKDNNVNGMEIEL